MQTDRFDGSCDEDEETELQDENLITTRNVGVKSSDSDTDSSEEKHDSTAASGATPSDNSSSQNTVGELKARKGTVWKNITGSQGMKELLCFRNVLAQRLIAIELLCKAARTVLFICL